MEADRLGNSKGVVAYIVVDSNFLILMVRGIITPSMISEVVDVSYMMLSPVAVKRELERLSAVAPQESTRRFAKRALELAPKLGITFIDEKYGLESTDDAIELLALDLKARGKYVFVATNDRELRRRLRAVGIPSMYYRESESRLELETDII